MVFKAFRCYEKIKFWQFNKIETRCELLRVEDSIPSYFLPLRDKGGELACRARAFIEIDELANHHIELPAWFLSSIPHVGFLASLTF